MKIYSLSDKFVGSEYINVHKNNFIKIIPGHEQGLPFGTVCRGNPCGCPRASETCGTMLNYLNEKLYLKIYSLSDKSVGLEYTQDVDN
jgi:hypothetical protein